MKFRFVDVGRTRTRYIENELTGSRKSIVFIHGGQFGNYYSSYGWMLNLQGLSKDYHVCAFDRLGMGYTDNPRNDSKYTMTSSVEHAYNFLATKGLKDAVIVGHSRGALLATLLALDHPEFVRKLVLVDSQTLAPDDHSTPKSFYEKIERNAPEIETLESVQREAKANSYSTKHIDFAFAKAMLRIATLDKTIVARKKMKRPTKIIFLRDLQNLTQNNTKNKQRRTQGSLSNTLGTERSFGSR